MASDPPPWKAVMRLFYLFSPGKVNFVHWCVLGLPCTQKTSVILRIHCVKEASVDKDGSQLMRAALRGSQRFRSMEWGWGGGWSSYEVLLCSLQTSLTEKCCFGTVGLSTTCPSHQLEAWKCDLTHQNPISASTKWELSKVLIWVWLQNLTLPMIQRVPGNWLLNYLKIMWVYVRTAWNR